MGNKFETPFAIFLSFSDNNYFLSLFLSFSFTHLIMVNNIHLCHFFFSQVNCHLLNVIKNTTSNNNNANKTHQNRATFASVIHTWKSWKMFISKNIFALLFIIVLLESSNACKLISQFIHQTPLNGSIFFSTTANRKLENWRVGLVSRITSLAPTVKQLSSGQPVITINDYSFFSLLTKYHSFPPPRSFFP